MAQNQNPRIQPSAKKVIRAELRKMSDDEIFADIERSRAMARHPFATPEDTNQYRARISIARNMLAARFAKELDSIL